MRHHPEFPASLFVLVLLLTACGASAPQEGPAARFFASPAEAVAAASRMLADSDFATLSTCYDLSLTGTDPEELRSGRFFVDTSASATAGPEAVTRWRHPFPPGSRFVSAEPLGDRGNLPCIWSVQTALEIDQGGGMVQRVLRECRMIERTEGFRFLPPAPVEDGGNRLPGPTPASPPVGPVTDEMWSAQGADPVLLYRPALRDRAGREVPRGGASTLPDLVAWIERQKALAAANRGAEHPGTGPGAPAVVYDPTDEELLLSLAGDRIFRTVSIAPPGIVEGLRKSRPDFTADRVEYAHVEIRRVTDAPGSSRLYALPPETRTITFPGGR